MSGMAPPPCVVDVSLSLAPAGLYWVLRLAEHVPVWLPQCHWAIVDDQGFHARAPDFVERLAGASELAQVTRQWRCACDRWGFESRPNLFWRGDGRADSVLPKDGDVELVERCDLLAAGFEARLRRELPNDGGASPMPDLDPRLDCARDTLALAAALGGARPIVLVRLAEDEAMPELAGQLEMIGVACPRLAEGPLRIAVRESLVPLLWRTGLAAGVGSGSLRLAGLSVVAPNRLEQSLVEGDELLTWDAATTGTETGSWTGAAASWWEMP